MKRSDLTIVGAVGLVGLVAAFWFLVLAPKREEASSLGDRVAELETAVSEQEQLALTAQEAKEQYGENYHRVVVLGKAVPADADTSGLLLTLQRKAQRNEVDLESVTLSDAGAAAATESPAPATAAPAEGTEASESSATADAESSATATTAAPATEATAATLPLGAAVGPAGLPVMPYDIRFGGGFYDVADLLDGIDDMVHAGDDNIGVSGRLLTVDGFSLVPVIDEPGTSGTRTDPTLRATLTVTSYVTPAGQDVLAGATPAAPAPATPVPTSTTAATP